jgi:hypothetical protein
VCENLGRKAKLKECGGVRRGEVGQKDDEQILGSRGDAALSFRPGARVSEVLLEEADDILVGLRNILESM